MPRLYLCLLLLLIALPAPPLVAQTRAEAVYDLSLRGFTLGRFRLAAEESGAAYSLAAAVDSTGVARIFRRFSYRATARGRLAEGRLQPLHYEEVADTGNRRSEAVLDYAGGAPRVLRYTSPGPVGADSPDPATQGGTLDPLSALHALLRDQPAAGLCDRTLVIFDGRRRSHIRLGPPRAAEGGVTCAGEYRRLQGFTAEEVARHVAIPLRVRYAPLGAGRMRALRVEMDTVYGLAAVHRR
jgi:hypothetical protein